jgi:hypothetical protein
MARTDYISLGVIARFFPVEKIREVLKQTYRASIRERDFYCEVLRCLLEGVQWLLDPSAKVAVIDEEIGS